jgi:hypothetical protein
MVHPNLLRAWPLGEKDGRLLVTVDRRSHPSLTDLLGTEPVDPHVCARVLGGAAAGADALAGRGLLARDLTPDAVMVHPEHGGVLADLGIPPELLLHAPLEQDPGPPFRSPEELRDRPPDARSTVYQLGVLLFTALVRAHPYQGPWSDVHGALRAGEAPRASDAWSDLPPGIDRVIARAIAPDPDQRYDDAGGFARAAAETLGGDVEPTGPQGARSSDVAQRRRSENRSAASAKRRARAPTVSSRKMRSRQVQVPKGETSPSTPAAAPKGAPDDRVANRPADVSPAPPTAPGTEASRASRSDGTLAENGRRAAKRRSVEAGQPRPAPNPASTTARRAPWRPRESPRPQPVGEHPKSSPKDGRSRRPLDGLRTGSSAAARRGAALLGTLLAVAGGAAVQVLTLLRRIAAAVVPAARTAARCARRAGSASAALFVRACRLLVTAGRRAGGRVGGQLLRANGVARQRAARLRHSAGAAAPATGSVVRTTAGTARRGGSSSVALLARAWRRVATTARSAAGLLAGLLPLVAGIGRRCGARLRRFAAAIAAPAKTAPRAASRAVGRGTRVIVDLLRRGSRAVAAAAHGAAGTAGGMAVAAGAITHRVLVKLLHARRSASMRAQTRRERCRALRTSMAQARFARRRLVLSAACAVVAGALAGIALGRAVQVDGAPSSLTRPGLTIQLPPGWEESEIDLGEPAWSPDIAIGSREERGLGLVAGHVGSEGVAERMLEGARARDGRRTPVRLGGLDAWRYAGLQPRPALVGTGYLVPTSGGGVVLICHAPRTSRAHLAECERAATTLVVRGERPLGLPSVDESRERLTEVIARLRASRAEGRRRLAAAELAPGQARAAASLERSHRRAARSLDRISPLADGRSLEALSAALRAAADAYGRLAAAATATSRSSYQGAAHAVIREEEALDRELARAIAA